MLSQVGFLIARLNNVLLCYVIYNCVYIVALSLSIWPQTGMLAICISWLSRNGAVMSRRVQISLWYIDLSHFSIDTEVGFWVTWNSPFSVLSFFWGGAKPVFPVTSVRSRHWDVCTFSSICCLSSKWKPSDERQRAHPGFNLCFLCDFGMLSVSCIYEPRLKPSLEKRFFEILLQTGSLASLMLR